MTASFLIIILWQGWVVVNRPFDDDPPVEIEEIRRLLDEDDVGAEGAAS